MKPIVIIQANMELIDVDTLNKYLDDLSDCIGEDYYIVGSVQNYLEASVTGDVPYFIFDSTTYTIEDIVKILKERKEKDKCQI